MEKDTAKTSKDFKKGKRVKFKTITKEVLFYRCPGQLPHCPKHSLNQCCGSGSIIFFMDLDPDPDPDLKLAHHHSPPPALLIFHI